MRISDWSSDVCSSDLTTAPRIVKRFGFRSLLLANALLSAVFLFGCALFTAATPQLVMLSWLLAYGFFRSLQFTCINTLAYADMPQTRMSQATSRSEEHTSELQSLMRSSYAVFCLK